jgi:hypothetical protein
MSLAFGGKLNLSQEKENIMSRVESYDLSEEVLLIRINGELFVLSTNTISYWNRLSQP